MKSYKELIVWQQAMQLAEQIYVVSSCFPRTETYGLQSQMRRAAVSVASNIAEGFGKRTPAEFCRYCLIAIGSAMELETQIELSRRLGFLLGERLKTPEQSVQSVLRLLRRLHSSLEKLKN